MQIWLYRLSAAVVAIVLAAAPAIAQVERTPSPPGASVRIVAPVDGATVSSPVTIVFGLSGMGVAPAGVRQENTGHHHLLINRDLPALNTAIPANAQSIHYGGGQTEAVLELSPGQYTLQLILGDWKHVPHEPPVYSVPIVIMVE